MGKTLISIAVGLLITGCTQKINGFYTKCIEVKEGVYYEYIISESSMELLNRECVR